MNAASRFFTRSKFMINGARTVAAYTVLKGFYNATRHSMELVNVRVEIDGLPPLFKGFKIALLSDFHSSLVVGEKHISTAAQLAMNEKPDVIALTGDFISGHAKIRSRTVGKIRKKYIDRCVDGLSQLKAEHGIFAVLGNHDFWSGSVAVERITAEFSRRIGVHWLRNTSVKLEKEGEHIHILGVDDFWSRSCSLKKAYKNLDDNSVKILLSHNPDINKRIDAEKRAIDLVLSGHTHGGQMPLPFRKGAAIVPSIYGQKYREGMVTDGKRVTYVSRGVGHLIAPVRFNSPPEVTVITLA